MPRPPWDYLRVRLLAYLGPHQIGAKSVTDPSYQLVAAVEAALADYSGLAVIVACSGGPDSVALTLTAAKLAPKHNWQLQVVIVDHGWSELSAANAQFAADQLKEHGVDQVEIVAAPQTPAENREAAAREIRYQILQRKSDELNGAPVLLGHTKDDQAETVLMRLVRGAGSKALAGMAPVRGIFVRPLLELDRAVVHAAIPETFSVIEDPANYDDSYLRVRVRKTVLPVMKAELGEDVVLGLVRSAQLLRVDSEYFVTETLNQFNECVIDNQLDVSALEKLHAAIRTRVIQYWLAEAGVPTGSLHQIHIKTVDELVTNWHGQKEINLPGGFDVKRSGNRLTISH
ncbi:MAG: tRNA lysidine(34) synthetase TilS [Actinobacteria bacterium]|nr:tRNA lysidine(34) synthetase TilS [Actinomycetota bacterium]